MKLKGAVILVLAAAAILWSCGTTGLLSKKEEPQVYYAAEQDLKLYPEPSFSQEPIAELPLNEKVLRYRNEKAFGYVKVERTGQKGWVENAKLKWKIEKQAVDVISPKEAEAATPPEESTQSKSKKKPDASVLDSY